MSVVDLNYNKMNMVKWFKMLLETIYVTRSIGLQFIKYRLTFLYSSICNIKPKGFSENIELRVDTSDYLVFEQVFAHKAYEMNLDFVPEVIIDCGANIGLTSLYFSNKYPDAKIIAIEPENSNYEMLLKNTCKYANITCLKKGIWYKSCFLKIVNPTFSNWGFMISESEIETDIEAISILDLIRKNRISKIDILKIDIEGSEKEIFEFQSEKWLPFVKILIVELHDNKKRGCAQSLFKALIPYQYDIQLKGDNLFIYFNHKNN